MTRESKIWLLCAVAMIICYMLPKTFNPHVEGENYNRADTMAVKFVSIKEAPDSIKETHNEHRAIIKNKVKTDMLTRHQKAEIYAINHAPMAQEEERRYNIPACITLAQGILECRSGYSKLAKQNNNHFGIKCFSRKCKKGHCTNFTDDSHKDFFKKYKSVKESYRDHSKFLQKKRYKGLKECKGYAQWAKGLKKAGYATGKNYDRKLIYIIERYQLYQYDVN